MADIEVTVGDSELSFSSPDEAEELQRALRSNDSSSESEGGSDGETEGAGAKGAPAKPTGKPTAKNDNDDDDDDERSGKVDAELDGAANDADREAIRARRREERKRRKQFNHDKVENLERTVTNQARLLREAQEQLLRLQNSDAADKLGQLDSAIEEAHRAVAHFKALHADAVAKGDGVTAGEALDRFVAARDQYNNLSGTKRSIVESQSRQPTAAPPIDPVVRRKAQEFGSRHAWYGGARSNDPDSRVLTMLDSTISQEGFDPRTPEYWAELESRGRRYLPHRFTRSPGGDENGYTEGASSEGAAPEPGAARPPRSPVGGAGQQRNGVPQGGAGGSFKLSAERVKAMKESGNWDDPKKRAAMVARYKAYDRDNGIS